MKLILFLYFIVLLGNAAMFFVTALSVKSSQKLHITKRSVKLLYKTLEDVYGCPHEWIMCYLRCGVEGFNFALCLMSKKGVQCKCFMKKNFSHRHFPF